MIEKINFNCLYYFIMDALNIYLFYQMDLMDIYKNGYFKKLY